MKNANLSAELQRRAADSRFPIPLSTLLARIAALGYSVDRRLDTPGEAKYVAGRYAGTSYPINSLYVIETDTRRSFSHVEARRDENFQRLQKDIRLGGLFAVVRGRIVEA